MKVGVTSNWPRTGLHNGLYTNDVEPLGSITAENYMVNCTMLLEKQTHYIKKWEELNCTNKCLNMSASCHPSILLLLQLEIISNVITGKLP
jgi:hypothetical protein